MPPLAPPVRQTTAAALASIGVHAAIFVVSAVVMARRLADDRPVPIETTYPVPTDDDVLVVELPTASGEAPKDTPAVATPPAVTPPPLPAPGGAKVARVDTGHAGRGGDEDAIAKARNLAPRVEEDTVTPWLRDDVDGEQENRLATGQDRRGWVDRRRALHPMELTFVASGRGFRYERHAPAVRDATRGIAAKQEPTPAGTQPGSGGLVAGIGEGAPRGGGQLGAEVARPTRGATWGTRTSGEPQLSGAPVALARPHVDRGNPSLANDERGRSGDRLDSELAVAEARRSLVATSTAGSERPGDGRGGSGGGATPAAGGRAGEGSTAGVQGSAEGPEVLARRERQTRYFMDLTHRLEPLLYDAFPHDAYSQLRNGTLYVDLTIAKDGHILSIIVTRPSGVPGFDDNVVAAIRGARMLEPIPDVLGGGPQTFNVPISGGWQLR